MSRDDTLGTWYCQLVDQEQSDEEAEQFGDYGDLRFRAPEKASKTDFATATLVFHEDGRYELTAEDYNSSNSSQGTWSDDEGLELREAEDCINGFDGLEYAVTCSRGCRPTRRPTPSSPR